MGEEKNDFLKNPLLGEPAPTKVSGGKACLQVGRGGFIIK